jgi:proteasome lid subunit RPN8/RPN11
MAEQYKLRIGTEWERKIRAHGVETYPHECCGALLGRDVDATGREILGLFPLVNRRDDSPRNRFAVTADDVRDAEKSAQAQKMDVVGWYHSHPDHPSRPSGYDKDHAWPWYSYIIVSVDSAVAKVMTSWRLNDDREDYTEEILEIVGSAKS